MINFGLITFATHYGIQPVELGRWAEGAGYESLFFAEHTHIPTSRISPFGGGGPLPDYYKQAYDPFVALAAVAAATETLKVGTAICLVTEHNPITLAKTVASLDQVSNGRAILGIGAGWNAEEMFDHGVDFKDRWKVTRERVLAMREIWNNEVAGGRNISDQIYLGVMSVIRQLRDQVRVTQARLAAMVGTSQSAIAAYESGAKSPTLRTLHRLATVLGLELEIRFVALLTREDRRSLAYHQVIAERLLRNPGQILEKARRNLKQLQDLHPHAAHLLSLWAAWLGLPPPMLTDQIMGTSELARDMRQVSPFSGVLSAAERRRVLEGFRSEMAA